MSLLNIKKLAAALAVACSLAFASTSSAALLDLSSSLYLGSIDPGAPASPTEEEGYINTLIAQTAPSTTDIAGHTYVRSANEPAGLIAADHTYKLNGDSVTEFDLTGTTSYILAKYGNTSHVWFTLGLSETVEILASIGKGGGLSHVSFFGGTPTNVPDSGATVALIALGLAGLGLVARRRKA
jgi:hypothetical protein